MNENPRSKCAIQKNKEIKYIDPSEITAADIFIQATQDTINQFISKLSISDIGNTNVLILGDNNLYTTTRLIDEVKPPGIIDNIVAINPNNNSSMYEFFCNDPLLLDTVTIHPGTLYDYLSGINSSEGKEFTSIWLQYKTWTGVASEYISPEVDIDLIFEKELIPDGGILAVSFIYGDTSLDSGTALSLALTRIPEIASKHDFGLISLCGKDKYYECTSPEIRSVHRYGRMALAVYRVKNIRD